MYGFVLMAHSGWRWIVLIVLVITLVKVLIGWVSKNQNWTNLDNNLVRLTHLVFAIQLLLGIILYVLYLTQGRGGQAVGAFTGSHVVPAVLAYLATLFALSRSRRGGRKYQIVFISLLVAAILVYGALATVGGIFA